MSLPIGESFVNGYRADNGLDYAMVVDLLSYNSVIPAQPGGGLPVIPWRMRPRHWICRYSGVEGDFMVRVICPYPFNLLPDPDVRNITTSNGYALTVVERVGEVWEIYAM